MTTLPQMTPAEHYLEAERLLGTGCASDSQTVLYEHVARALVHATLATAGVDAIINVPDPEDATRSPTVADLASVRQIIRPLNLDNPADAQTAVRLVKDVHGLDALTADAWITNAERTRKP